MKKTLITIGLTTVVIFAILGVLVFTTFSSFGGAVATEAPAYDNRSFGAEPSFAPISAPLPASADSFGLGGGADMAYEESAVSNVAAAERMVIQNVDISIVVTDPKMRMDEISSLAVEMGGFVVSSNLYQSSYGPNNIEVPEGNITIRVPSESLDDALEKIKEDTVDITYENRSGEDVTNQYVDLQSRLKAKQDAEKKLNEILQDAVDSENVLAIYNQIQSIQTEIEVLKGQIKYYDESVALSAISIHLVAEETVKPIEIGGWKLQGTANEAVQDLILFTQGFTQFLIRFFLNYLWRILLIGLLLYGFFISGRAVYNRLIKPRVVAEVKEEKKK